MTIDQNTAVWEMRRKGLHALAYQAEQQWDHGEFFEWNEVARATRALRTLVERCNRQVRKHW